MTWLVLIATITTAELQASMLAAMTAAGLPTSSWTKDGFWQNLVNWIAFLLRAAYLILRDVALNSFLGTATGPGLTDLAAGTFGTARRIETFATGTVTLLNASGSPIDEPAEAITFEQVADASITYKTSAATGPVPNGSQFTVPIVCDIAGTVGNALAGTFPSHTIELVTVLSGVSVVSNSVVVGQDAQTDDELRGLAAKQASNLSEGHVNKFEWVVLNTNTDGTISEPDDGKTRLNINRVAVSNDSVNGVVTVVLASPSGAVDAGEYATAISILTQYVLANPGTLDDYNATPVEVDIDATIELEADVSTDGVDDAAEQFLTDWFTSTKNKISGRNGKITQDELRLQIGRANDGIRKVTLTSINGGAPADVTLAFDEVATPGTFNFTVVTEA